jgi:pimeloyl-ACP methyl ester carboxylesterase
MPTHELRTRRLPGLVLTDMTFAAPLDYADPGGQQITVFARAAVAPGKEHAALPWLVFFQGGPGFGSPRPNERTGWLKRALQDYRVLLMDGRGTGLSTPVTAASLARFDTPQAQADYVAHFRADSIVADAELIRRQLLGEGERWTALGQSFGGFCVTHYLSAAPQGLAAALITGGLPPLTAGPDDIYRHTYHTLLAKNRRYFARYPEDAGRAREIVDYLSRREVPLPSGGRLTPRRFQQLGMAFGMSDGFESVHYLLEGAFEEGPAGRRLSYAFLRGFEDQFAFETNPIYALLHEAEYCQGTASHWSAERVRDEFPAFGLRPDHPVYFTGEMVYPWMFEDYAELRPLAAAAEILAARRDWPPLYDLGTLAANAVPAAAAVYFDDMYVARELSLETAARINGLRVWITNEYEHNGLRADGERVFGRLLDMVNGDE